jgi:hypothetical protein
MENIRSYKFYDNTALFDYICTIIASFIVTYYTKIPLTITTIGLFVLSIFFHVLFHIKTPSSTYLFGK